MKNQLRTITSPTPPQAEPAPSPAGIVCGETSLCFPDSNPSHFMLLQGNELLLQGELHIAINDEQLNTSDICWRTRAHPTRLEKWVNLHSHNQLSLNITYYLTDHALVIDYLARCGTPSRITIRHQLRDHTHWLDDVKGVQQLPDSIADRVTLSRYQRNDEPSQLPTKSGVHVCQEAFTATQMIRFSEKCDLGE